MTLVTLEHPERWWLAVQADMPWLTDPDVEDGHPRHADCDDRDWAGIATAVQDVMAEVVAGRGRIELIYEDEPSEGNHLVVDADLEHLDATDQDIVTEWFWHQCGPIADPWDDRLVNGRHRLWNAWKAAPQAALPVESALLKYLDDIPLMDGGFAAGIYRGAMEGIELMPPTVMKRNPDLCDELRRVACLGGHDGLTPSSRWSDGDRGLYDAVQDDPDLLPHTLAGQPLTRHDPVPPPDLDDGPWSPQRGAYEPDWPLEDRRAVALRWATAIAGGATVIVMCMLVFTFVIAHR
jgi:hypothetical protein